MVAPKTISPLLPRENTPLLTNPKTLALLSSNSKTFANVFIAIVGSAVLGLPYTFKKTGWAMGTITILSVASITYHCMMLLVHTRRKIESSNQFAKISSFGDLGFAVYGPKGRSLVDAMIVLSQASFCVAYLIFIANTLLFMFHSQSLRIIGFLSPKALYIWGCFPFQLGLNSIPTLTHLAPLSIFADLVDMGAMGIVMAQDLFIFINNGRNVHAFRGFSVFFYGLGVAIYSFEGVGMVLPLEAETHDKSKFGKILGLCMFSISMMYVAFGVLGYIAFGDETKDIVTTNFGLGLLSYLVQIGLCVNLFFTFPIMMNPVYEVVERRACEGMYCLWLRWAVVLLVCLVALFVPNFADFLSLVGSSVCCILGFVLPSLFHWIVFRHELKWRELIIDGLVMGLGLVAAVSGTWLSVSDIFRDSVEAHLP